MESMTSLEILMLPISGKTLLMKTKARQVASLDGKKNTYYISMSSTRYHTFPYNQVSGIPSIFDIASKIQFDGTGVQFLSALNLKEKYKTETGEENSNVYELIQWFVERDCEANYFVDEFGCRDYISKFIFGSSYHLLFIFLCIHR